MTNPQPHHGPTQMEVVKYFLRLGLEQKHADAFFYYYSLVKWEIHPGQHVRNWKVLAYNWVKSFSVAAPVQRRSIRKPR
ncbi:hypothetical protein DCC81_03810 [Chitinophaga parva]|uniref:Uncharacterized protein n=1 Tax=Chitinophaga parva TaxID=2169414 RepID=A0A2T7BLU4_9BACT|nr:hypothetical protein DCC81_03810 [Chitinophaga parva]